MRPPTADRRPLATADYWPHIIGRVIPATHCWPPFSSSRSVAEESAARSMRPVLVGGRCWAASSRGKDYATQRILRATKRNTVQVAAPCNDASSRRTQSFMTLRPKRSEASQRARDGARWPATSTPAAMTWMQAPQWRPDVRHQADWGSGGSSTAAASYSRGLHAPHLCGPFRQPLAEAPAEGAWKEEEGAAAVGASVRIYCDLDGVLADFNEVAMAGSPARS